MKIAMIGLGRMGANMVKRLRQGGHECVVYDQSEEKRKALTQDGVTPAASLEMLVEQLTTPRTVWIMLPAGAPTEETVQKLGTLLQPGDMIVDGGNSYFKDDVRRSTELSRKKILYFDVGVSGGVWGLERGYCLMIGGPREAALTLDPIFKTLAPGRGSIPSSPGRASTPGQTADQGYVYCGPSGAGHFVKMVHNGIEYGMMQSLAEGFHILEGASQNNVAENYRYDLDLAEISEVWRRGSVVSSWLLDLIAIALNEDSSLSGYEGTVSDSGEGRWTIQAAIEEAVPADVLATSLFVRFRSRESASYAEKLLSAMRHGFGGHREMRKGA